MSVFERHPKKTLAAIVGVSIVLLDFGGTWVASRLRERLTTDKVCRVRSPIYHHDLKPLCQKGHVKWGPSANSLHVNSLGFRDATTREVSMRSKEYRVLFIGDSFTEGVGVDFEKTFVGLVGSELAKSGIEVLNAGVSSYSPIIYYRKVKDLIETRGLEFNELVVYLDISDILDEVFYDFDEKLNVIDKPIHPQGPETFSDFLRANTTLIRTFASIIKNRGFTSRNPMPTALGNPRSSWTYDEKVYATDGFRGLENARIHMTLLRDYLTKRGIRLTLAVYPWPDQIDHEEIHSRQLEFWKRWTSQLGVGFVEHFSDFIGRERKREIIDRNFIPGDVHWNEAGHRVIAESLLRQWKPKKN